MLIDKNGLVKPELISLVRMQTIAFFESGGPRELSAALQREWVKGKDGVLRAQLGGRFPTEDELALLRALGLVSIIHINPSIQYRGLLLLGATMKAIARRMKFVADEYASMLRREPPPIWFLGSERPIDNDLEGVKAVPAIVAETGLTLRQGYGDEATLTNEPWPAVEYGVFNFLRMWSDYQNSWWDGRRCEVVIMPLVKKPDGSMRNPNTGETVKEWTKKVYQTDHWLVVSSQPFCQNQLLAVERATKEADPGYDEHDPERTSMTFDVCGPEAPPLPLSRWLDNIAKQLWEEVQLLPK